MATDSFAPLCESQKLEPAAPAQNENGVAREAPLGRVHPARHRTSAPRRATGTCKNADEKQDNERERLSFTVTRSRLNPRLDQGRAETLFLYFVFPLRPLRRLRCMPLTFTLNSANPEHNGWRNDKNQTYSYIGSA